MSWQATAWPEKQKTGSPALVVFGPGDKLRWLEAVAMHPQSTDLDARVGVAITNRLDKYTGEAVVSARWIAEWIGRTEGAKPRKRMDVVPGERSAQDSVTRMKRNALLQVTVGGGRNKANTYRPLIAGVPKPHGQPWGNGPENPTASREVSLETPRPAVPNPTASRTKPHGQPCTLPKSLPKALPNVVVVDDARAREEAARERQQEWHSIWTQLVVSLGAEVTGAWFRTTTVGRYRDHELELYVEGQFIRGRIERDYMAQLEAACRYEYPGLKSVRLVAAEALRAAE